MIHIIQCLCPHRHCIMAIAYDSETIAPADAMLGLMVTVESAVEVKEINPWCHICQSRDWHYEDAPTRFKTIDEAEPVLKLMEQMQKDTHDLFAKLNANKN